MRREIASSQLHLHWGLQCDGPQIVSCQFQVDERRIRCAVPQNIADFFQRDRCSQQTHRSCMPKRVRTALPSRWHACGIDPALYQCVEARTIIKWLIGSQTADEELAKRYPRARLF